MSSIHASARTSRTELAVLLTLPLLAFWLVPFKPLSQDEFLDPYVYTGFINNFYDLFERYGTTYYGVRFGLLFPARLATTAFGSVGGFFVLRYALVVMMGLAYWTFVKQRYGRAPAYALLSILLTSPFMARTVLWDHPDASGVPFMFTAIVLLLMGQHRSWRDVVAGVCAGMAVHSNIFILAPLGLFVAAYAIVWTASGGRLGPLARRLRAMAIGALVVTAIGVFYYAWAVGVWDIFSITVNMATWLVSGGTKTWRNPGTAWMARQWWVLTPLILTAVGVAFQKFRATPFHDAVVVLAALLTTGFYYTFEFLFDGNTLQLFYYFSYFLPVIFLLLAVIVGRLWQHLSGGAPTMAALLLVLATVGPWLFFSAFSFGPAVLPGTLVHHLVVVAVAIVCLVVATSVSRWRPVSTMLATVAVGAMFFSCFAKPLYASMIDRRVAPSTYELDVYRVALQLIQAVPRVAEHPGVIRFWYGKTATMNSIQSTFLWGFSKLHPTERALPELGSSEVGLLREPDTTGLILLAEEATDLPRGRDALSKNGISYTVVDQRVLAAGGYRIHFERLTLAK